MAENINNTSREQENSQSIIGRTVQKGTLYGKYTSEKKNLSGLLFFSIIVNLGQFVLLLFFGAALMFVYSGRDVSVVVPPTTLNDTKLVFGSNRVNKPVYEVYADFIARSFGNVNYENVDERYLDLSVFVASEKYHDVRKALASSATHIKANFITQEFKLQKVEIAEDERGVLAKCSGFMSRKVGSKGQFEELPYMIKLWLKPYRGNVMIMGMSSELSHDTGKTSDQRRVQAYEKDNRYVNF